MITETYEPSPQALAKWKKAVWAEKAELPHPKLRYLSMVAYNEEVGEEHPGFSMFLVSCWFSFKQMQNEGSDFWLVNGKPAEVTIASYDHNVYPQDLYRYSDMKFVGTSKMWLENGMPSKRFLDKVRLQRGEKAVREIFGRLKAIRAVAQPQQR